MENAQNEPKTIKYRIAKTLTVLLVLSLIIGVLAYSQRETLRSYPALKVSVSTAINESTGFPTVTNATIEQTEVPFYYRRADSIPKFPEITIEAKANAMMSEPIAYRSGVFRPEEGNYTLMVTFYDGKEPKVNDTIILAIRLSDFRGSVVKKTTAFHLWK